MNYKIRYSKRAEVDADEIGAYYDKVSPGLSFRFFNDVNLLIGDLKRNPSAFHYYKKNENVRRANLEIFPFGVFFYISEVEQTVILLAIIHKRRSKSFIGRKLK